MQWIGNTISDGPAKPHVPNVSTLAAYGDGSEVSEWQEWGRVAAAVSPTPKRLLSRPRHPGAVRQESTPSRTL